jgi:hypothetical protein
VGTVPSGLRTGNVTGGFTSTVSINQCNMRHTHHSPTQGSVTRTGQYATPHRAHVGHSYGSGSSVNSSSTRKAAHVSACASTKVTGCSSPPAQLLPSSVHNRYQPMQGPIPAQVVE